MKQLTDKQQKFLEVLFEEAQGSAVMAKKLAGYSDNVATSSITSALKEEIADVKEAASEVANQAKDVVDAAKGKK